MSEDLIEQGAVAIAEAVRNGDVSAEQIAAVALSRLNRRGRALNAIVDLDEDFALEQARATDEKRARGESLPLLAGVPMAHKDLFYRAGREAACGSKIRRGFIPEITSSALARLDAAGSVDLGTLHMTEFAVGPTGYNEHLGHARNPWNPSYAPGGSSSGSAIVVASGCVPIALGSDTGGSIRHPSAMCGITGLKPTMGAVSRYGVMPLSGTLDVVGPMARHARDLARVMDVVAGPDSLDRATFGAPKGSYESVLDRNVSKLQFAIPKGFYADELSSEVVTAIGEFQGTLKFMGAQLRATNTPDVNRLNVLNRFVMAVEGATLHRKWLQERPHDYADQVRSRLEPGLFYPATRYVEALSMRDALAQDWVDTVIGDADVAVLPVLTTSVPSIQATMSGNPNDIAAIVAGVTRNTGALNYLGLPAISIHCGFSSDGLPIGVQVVGRPWTEPLLIKIADAFQSATHWHEAVPPHLAALDDSRGTLTDAQAREIRA